MNVKTNADLSQVIPIQPITSLQNLTYSSQNIQTVNFLN